MVTPWRIFHVSVVDLHHDEKPPSTLFKILFLLCVAFNHHGPPLTGHNIIVNRERMSDSRC